MLTSHEKKNFFTHLIWLFPSAYLFHIIEESAGFAKWVNETLHGQMNITMFYINNAIFMLILIGLCLLVFKKRNTLSVLLLFAWVSGQQFWNFVFHLYAQFKFNAYSPGSLTGIFLYVPIYAGMTFIALREKYITWYLWLICFIIGLVGMAFTIWGGLYHFEKFPLEQWI